MEGQFALTFVDLVAYLLPGLVVLVPLAWLSRHRDAFRSANLLQTIALFGASYILGILIHRLSFIVVYPSYAFTGRFAMEGLLSQNPDIDLVVASVRKRLGLVSPSGLQAYLYAQSLVVERFPQSALSAERLQYLALLCRSLIVSLVVAAVGSFVLLRRSDRWESRYWWYSVPLGLAVLLLHRSFSIYWVASVDRTLRAYLIWASLQ